MERICEYCKDPFEPKRTDALYCSASCRQLAYVLRKAADRQSIDGIKDLATETENVNKSNASELYPSIYQGENENATGELTDQLTDNEGDPSITDTKIDVYPSTDERLSVKSENQLPVNTEIAKPSIHQPVEPKEEYTEYNSLYIGELNKLIDERDIVAKLFALGYSDVRSYALWLNIRFKCLVECLLTFSERREMETDDLKEVCDAFTSLIQSRHFEYLGTNYPYHQEIVHWRDSIKKFCIDAGQNETIELHLKKGKRQTLLVTRYELANNAPKVSYSKLNFNE